MPGGARSMKGEKQMIYKNITFKADPFSYNLEFDDRMTDEDNELLIGTSEALWIISIGAYEVEHDILEERVLEQLSYHIPRYEMGKYNDITPEEQELLEKDIALIRSKVELWKLKSYED